jgi:hypothetical protein
MCPIVFIVDKNRNLAAKKAAKTRHLAFDLFRVNPRSHLPRAFLAESASQGFLTQSANYPDPNNFWETTCEHDGRSF